MSPSLTPPVGPEDRVAGPADAPVTLLEFGDYECPYCGRAEPVVLAVRRLFADTLLFAYRHFPSPRHPHAERAAEAAEAAGEQGRFWEMHELLFAHQDALDDRSLMRYAAAVAIDGEIFADHMRLRTFHPRVHAHIESGRASGVPGTPTFFVNGERWDGGHDLESLSTAIQLAIVY